MNKKISFIFLSAVFIYSGYCILQLGVTWDVLLHHELGKDRLHYLFSLGSNKVNEETFKNTKYYSGAYSTISTFFTYFLSKKYIVESIYFVNLVFSFLAIFGIQNISKEFFNRQIGKITFVICLFNPIFFGHMGMNSIDVAMASAYIWFFYTIIKYLKKQHISEKKNYYVFFSALSLGFFMGGRFSFIIMLLPIFLFVFLEIFYFNVLVNKKFLIKLFFKDAIKVLIIAYFFMVLFWPETHPNIFLLPIQFTIEGLFYSFGFGPPFVLYNGEITGSYEIPNSYLLINLFYKMPEFIILSYILFACFFFKIGSYFKKEFKGFYFKIFSVFMILIFPNILLLVYDWALYDGVRLFLYLIPFICIIPAILFFFLYKAIKRNLYKFIFSCFVFLQIFFLFNFFALTPYQYVYLNLFAGKNSEHSKKFENDYWGVSTKELISKISDHGEMFRNSEVKIALCGLTDVHVNNYLKKNKNFKFKIVDSKESFDFIIMNNRVSWDFEDTGFDLAKKQTCFQKFSGVDLIKVKRRGLVLSRMTKI